MHPARRRLAFLSAAIAALLAVVLPPAAASAAMQPAAGTRVGASHPRTVPAVGPSRPVSPAEGRCGPALRPGFAAGACVAAEDGATAAATDEAGADSEQLVEQGCGESFTAGTKVLLASGAAIPISQLKPGDKVLATNTKTGRTSPEAVAAVMVKRDTDKYDLTIRSGHRTAVIDTTRNHLFWDVSHDRWVKAGALKHGDHLRTSSGSMATVVGGHTPASTVGWMWDLSVPGGGDHDFYIDVVNTAVLVHNCPVGPGEANPAENPDMGSLNKVNDSQLREQLGDIHEFKAEILGRGAQLSRFNVYVDKSSGYLFLMARGGEPIPTYFNIGGA